MQAGDRHTELVLFFTSTSAQVWSAFLIFVVLLLRNMAIKKKRRVKEIWAEARVLWRDLIPDLKNLVAKREESRDPEIHSLLMNADTNFRAFRNLLQTMSD